jgi:hypothetical protein
MANVIHRTTGEYRLSVNTPEYDPAVWLINPQLPAGVPQKYWKVDGDRVVEMSDSEKDAVDNPPEPMADRHRREQAGGVTLENGWVLAYTVEAQTRMGTAKDIADLLILGQDPGEKVPFNEVDGTQHMVNATTAYRVLGEYMSKVLVEYLRQEKEVRGG